MNREDFIKAKVTQWNAQWDGLQKRYVVRWEDSENYFYRDFDVELEARAFWSAMFDADADADPEIYDLDIVNENGRRGHLIYRCQ